MSGSGSENLLIGIGTEMFTVGKDAHKQNVSFAAYKWRSGRSAMILADYMFDLVAIHMA